MNQSLTWLMPLVPLIAAGALWQVRSRQLAAWFGIGTACLLTLLICVQPSYPLADSSDSSVLRCGNWEVHLALLAAVVSGAENWLRLGSVRGLDARIEAAQQAMLAATLLALLADDPVLTWLALVLMVTAAQLAGGLSSGGIDQRRVAVLAACLMLILFGTLLLYLAVGPGDASLTWHSLLITTDRRDGHLLTLASVLLLLGYGSIAVLTLADGRAGILVPTVSLLVILRVRLLETGSSSAANLCIVLGLVALAAVAWTRLTDVDRTVRTGLAQLGLTALAFGLGGEGGLLAGWLTLTSFMLARSAELGSVRLAPAWPNDWTQTAARWVPPVLVLFGFTLIAGQAAGRSPGLLGLAAVCALAACLGLIQSGPPISRRTRIKPMDVATLLPMWLQLGTILLLAVAMPPQVFDWFRALAEVR